MSENTPGQTNRSKTDMQTKFAATQANISGLNTRIFNFTTDFPTYFKVLTKPYRDEVADHTILDFGAAHNAQVIDSLYRNAHNDVVSNKVLRLNTLDGTTEKILFVPVSISPRGGM